MHTKYGKVKFNLDDLKGCKLHLQSMLKQKAWLNSSKKQDKPVGLYSGAFNKVQEDKKRIGEQTKQVEQSMQSIDSLFVNIREIKKIMGNMKAEGTNAEEEDSQVGKILGEIGFVSALDKGDSQFTKKLASDLYNICENVLFKQFGGMVPLLDLFYFYNIKLKLSLVSPQELLKACSKFQKLGFNAKLVEYPSNIKMI